MDSSYYCDRFYTIRGSVNLPRHVQFQNGETLTINYATYAEVRSSLEEFLRSASERGDNVGTDEFVGSAAESLTEYSIIFTARMNAAQVLSTISAFIIISPSTFAGTRDPCLADIHVIRTSEVTDSTYGELVELSTELTRELNVGYTDCIMSVAVSCDELINVLTGRHHFKSVGVVPKSVQIANGIGFVDSKVLVKNIAPPGREPRSLDEVLSMLAKHGLIDGPADDAKYDQATLLSIPFLPLQRRFHKANLTVTIRNMRKEEDRVLYELLRSSRELGEGFPLHDRPNLAYLRNAMLKTNWCFVFEESDSGTVIGFLCVRHSQYHRSQQPKCTKATWILRKEYQNRGIAHEINSQVSVMLRQLGFMSIMGSTYANNVRSLKAFRGKLYELVVPRSGFLIGSGWQDVILSCQDISNLLPSTENTEEERRLPSTIEDDNKPTEVIASKL